MKLSLRTKLDQLSARLAELDALLAAEDATRDLDRYRALSRERAEIDPVVARFGEFEQRGSATSRRRSSSRTTRRCASTPTRSGARPRRGSTR